MYRWPITILCCVLIVLCGTYSTAEQPTHRRSGSRRQSRAGEEAWGYITVRPGAHMFYWLYYTTHPNGYHSQPLVVWFQGGPGASSCGYGNFEEIGPLDVNLFERNTTWVKEANVLFIDNPVGAGYSYVDDSSLFTTDVQQITDDLIVFFTEFMAAYPPFKTIPIFIFGQSYGGKMGSHFAVQLYKDIEAGTMEATLSGFAMGNSWISPEDSTMSWGPLLYQMGLVDEEGLEAIQAAARLTKRAIDEERWQDATDNWGKTEVVVLARTHYVDFYNILKFNLPELGNRKQRKIADKFPYLPAAKATDPLDELMNGPIREYLGIIPANVTWGGQSDDVFTYQELDFMKPVITTVDEALKNTSLQVVVYEGQLDLICDTNGAMDWVRKLTWSNMDQYYNNATREYFVNNDSRQNEMFVKAYDRFKFYWVLAAGHSVPADNGRTALRMLTRILNNMDG